MKRFALFAVLIGLLALPLYAQIPTGTLSGHVTDGKDPLPGVTVTITSPNLQGTRTAISGGAGDYIFKFVPAGEYHVKFELQGFTTLDTGCKVNAASEAKVDAVMPMTQVAEELTVTGSYETISSTGTATTTMEKSLIDTLPTQKDIANVALLTAGVIANPGAQNAVQIGGSMSYENLIMVNGVQIQDNVRGTPTGGLYIQDAIQETTTSVSSVSAEYGRFTGGVINLLTKSGGNEFHASIRDSLTNDDWTAKSEKQTADNLDKIVNTYEATLGGFILKDRLWFFASGRKQDLEAQTQTFLTNFPVPQTSPDKRYEGKLTVAITPNHRVVGSYIKDDISQTNYGFRVSGLDYMDLASVYDRSTPSELYAANYTGVLTDNFFVEGQYSKKMFTFINSGGRYTDLERGTPLEDYNNGFGAAYNSPIFCAVCTDGEEKRDNEDILLKASWFLSSAGMGSHDIVLGFDRFKDMRKTNNYQSGSSYQIYVDGEVGLDTPGLPHGMLVDAAGTPYPIMVGNSEASYILWTPMLQLSKGNEFRTDSIFLNDKWRLNNNFTFNVGVRYDKNHGQNADGVVTTKDSNYSPRLAVTFDPTGSGALQFNASYAKYVAAIANTQADAGSAAGTPASLYYLYAGPDLNTNCVATNPNPTDCLTSHQVIAKVFEWFNGLSAADKANLLTSASVPGVNLSVKGSLRSPNTDEFTLGVATRIGSAGALRVDLVDRKFHDFYVNVTNLSTGQVSDEFGNNFDKTFVQNDDKVYKREYKGLHLSASYRVSDRLDLGGNYTLSELKGNFTGETGGSGSVRGGALSYPEYQAFKNNNPVGYLPSDQRHRARVYGVYNILDSKNFKLAFSLMEFFSTGTPYSAVGNVGVRAYVTGPQPCVDGIPAPGCYLTPPTQSAYYFSRRGAYRYPNITRTDISFPFSFSLPVLGTDLQFFVEPRVTNLFNEKNWVNANTTIYTSRNAGRGLSAFNPYTDTPVECKQASTIDGVYQCTQAGANWLKGTQFGKPQQPTTAQNLLGDYQLPRTYTVSFGLRF